MKKTLYLTLFAVVFLLSACQSKSEKQFAIKEVKQVVASHYNNAKGIDVQYVDSKSAVAEIELPSPKDMYPPTYLVYQSVIKKNGQWKLGEESTR